MKKCIQFFVGFCAMLAPQLAVAAKGDIDDLSWVGRVADVTFEVASSASLSIYYVMQEIAKPLLAIFFGFWIVFYAIQVIRGELDKDQIKILFRRSILFFVCYTLLSVQPQTIFKYTFTPLVQISTSYTTEFFAKNDSYINTCMKEEKTRKVRPDYVQKVGVFDNDTLSGLTCITESATRTLQGGIRLGWWMIGSGIVHIVIGFVGMILILPAALIATGGATILMGAFLIHQCFTLILDILWMLIALMMQLAIAVILTPLAIMTRVFRGEETTWYSDTPLTKIFDKVYDYFKNAFIGIIIWSIAMTILIFIFEKGFSFVSIDLGDQSITFEQVMNTESNLYDNNGDFQDWAMIKIANTMLFNLKAWFFLVLTLLLGKWMFGKFKKMAEEYTESGTDMIQKSVQAAAKNTINALKKNTGKLLGSLKKK